jgi:hypothetical protein
MHMYLDILKNNFGILYFWPALDKGMFHFRVAFHFAAMAPSF